MESTIQQSIKEKKRRFWQFWRKKEEPVSSVPQVQQAVTELSFYERAIEWTHRADKVVNLVLGYLLAVASVLGFMDVLSNGQVLSSVPWAFFLWLAIMGLGVDFQILLVIGRMPELIKTIQGKGVRWLFIAFNLGFLGFLAYMSIIIGAVFTEHRDMVAGPTSTISAAMGLLHIDATNFVFQRAALATLLLILMAVDRAMERWRMQIAASTVQVVTPQVDTATPALAPVQTSDFLEAIKAMREMNNQNLQAMQELHMRSTQVTVSLIEETFTRMTATLSISGGTEAKQLPQGVTDQDPDELEGMASPGSSSQGIHSLLGENSYKEAIEILLTQEPELSDRELAQRVGCSVRTANRWKTRMQQPANA